MRFRSHGIMPALCRHYGGVRLLHGILIKLSYSNCDVHRKWFSIMCAYNYQLNLLPERITCRHICGIFSASTCSAKAAVFQCWELVLHNIWYGKQWQEENLSIISFQHKVDYLFFYQGSNYNLLSKFKTINIFYVYCSHAIRSLIFNQSMRSCFIFIINSDNYLNYVFVILWV